MKKRKVHVLATFGTACGARVTTGTRVLVGVGNAAAHPDVCKSCLKKRGKK